MTEYQQKLKSRLGDAERLMKQASEEGRYADFQKWEFERNNIKTLIEMNTEQAQCEN